MQHRTEEKNTFSKTDTGIDALTKEQPTEPNAIEVPAISLPKGGGALKGIDEKFEVNPSNGTAGFSIPLPLTPGRNGFTPSLSLTYNSGAGNGPFGLGWSAELPMIQRKTDKQLPTYETGPNEDTFLFSGAEDLVPYLNEESQPLITEHPGLTIQRYRPRLEGGFSRIEKITLTEENRVYWKVTSGDNTVTYFGLSPATQLYDPVNEAKVYAWLAEFSYDNKGNWIRYAYKSENLDAIPDRLSEKNRHNGLAPFTNRYLKRVYYGNREPWYADDPYQPTLPADDAEVFFELVMDYGEHQAVEDEYPSYDEIQPWNARQDPFSSYRSGFEIRTYRLCERLLMFHHFAEENQFTGTPDETAFGIQYLVRSMELAYQPSDINQSGQTEVTYLRAITQKGHIRTPDGTYSSRSLPPLEFDYQQLLWNTETKSVDPESTIHAPSGLMTNYQWVDLYGEGVSGMLTEQAGGWYYKRNLGDPQENGQVSLANAAPVIPKPALTGLNGALSLQDLEANSQKQLVVHSPGMQGFFELDDDENWKPFQAFAETANVDLQDPNTRMMDLTGDGKPDLVMTDENVFTWHAANGKAGYHSAKKSFKPLDEEQGPALLFRDTSRQEAVFLADMTGDGLTDILRIRNGEICYWANRGYGQFSAKVTMDNCPVFDRSDQFSPDYLQLADVSGTGPADIVYFGKNEFKAYLNLSGNAWSDAHETDPFFPTHPQSKVAVIDLLGTGTSCLVWSSSLPQDRHAPMRYMDLMSSKKPHVMTRYVNNLGKEVSLEYKSSTHFYLKDKREGTPWITRLPFPVQVISKQVVEEKITQVRFTTAYSYHHGYYDHAEREFRGFGRVDQWDTEHYDTWHAHHEATSLERSEDLYQPPTLTRTWFHTGAFLDKEKLLNQFEKEYWYEQYNQSFPDEPIAVSEPQLPDARLVITFADDGPESMPAALSADEWREGLRACKGMVLRQEVFALDGEEEALESMQKQAKPFTVATHNCQIRRLQARQNNRYAVWIVTESEALTLQYERNEQYPRVTHALNVELDELGNVLERASVVYPRQQPDPELPTAVQEKQAQTFITYTRNQYTNDVSEPEAYRLRQLAGTSTFEITGLPLSGNSYQLEDFRDLLTTGSEAIGYHETPTVGTQRRCIEQARSLFYRDDLTGPLPLGTQETQGIGYESYQLAYTPGLIQDIFGDKVPDPDELLNEGRYVQQDGNWWIRSGTVQFLEGPEAVSDVAQRFYTPISYTDPFGSVTQVSYYKDYYLLMATTTDAVGNEVVVENYNFRTLAPIRVRDMNHNVSAALLDELGLVKAVAVMGKGAEADNLEGLSEITDDSERALIQHYLTLTTTETLRTTANELLQHATSRLVYDFDRYQNAVLLLEEQLDENPETLPCAVVTLLPTVTGSIAREAHHQQSENSPLQLSFEYSDGAGNVAMAKTQAEPGEALQLNLQPDCQFTLDTIATGSELRWIGNGRTVLNNKGNPVKQYEPYFSTTPFYEDAKELTERGVTPIAYYDALGRNRRMELPDGSFTLVDFDAWQQTSYDPNDTVMDSRWYLDRGSPDPDGPSPSAPDAVAAWKAAQHHGTPTRIHLDTLGRPIASVVHNRVDGVDAFYLTQIDLDIEGNTRAVVDARGNAVMQYRNDLLGHRVYQLSMDAGERWMVNNAMGNPVQAWDSRQHVVTTRYDALQRPLEMRVTGGDGDQPLDHVVERMEYGEGQPDELVNNLRGQAVRHYDTAGQVETLTFDFKGNPLTVTRRLAHEYKNTVNWEGPDPDSGLTAEVFTTSTTYDALNRPVAVTGPDGSISSSTYNEAGLLERVSVNMAAANGAGRIEEVIVQQIDYDEKGQRQRIRYGNDVTTRYFYDPLTFRLVRLESQRQNGERLQDLWYRYDPIGNITEVEDLSIPTVFFGNHQVEPRSQYTYDALYRLTEATGREHIAQTTFGTSDNWNDLPFLTQHQPNDPMAWRTYTQSYNYDAVGNILEMQHVAPAGNWTRSYQYEATTNRLESTQTGANTYHYAHHAAHGFMMQLPHLRLMNWDFKDQLTATSRQVVNSGTPETTYYTYDSSGQRVRKITENQAGEGAAPTLKEERIYLGSVEVFRRHSGQYAGLERQTLHVADDSGRVAMVDTRNEVDDDTEVRTMRYQLSNHLGSATLEVNEAGTVISYEEYHPYGTTAYQARNADIRTAAKRYRYTGMERDEETGLSYHTARYYIPWLGRWSAPDPIGIGDGVNVFQYSHNKPLKITDRTGHNGEEIDKAQVSKDISELLQRLATTKAGSDESRQIIEGIQILREIARFSPDGPESMESKIGKEKLRKQQKDRKRSEKRVSKIGENRDKLAISASIGTVVLYASGAAATAVGIAAVSYGLGTIGVGATSGYAGGLVSGSGNELLRQSEAGEKIDLLKVGKEGVKEGYVGAATGVVFGIGQNVAGKVFNPNLTVKSVKTQSRGRSGKTQNETPISVDPKAGVENGQIVVGPGNGAYTEIIGGHGVMPTQKSTKISPDGTYLEFAVDEGEILLNSDALEIAETGINHMKRILVSPGQRYNDLIILPKNNGNGILQVHPSETTVTKPTLLSQIIEKNNGLVLVNTCRSCQ